MAALPPQIKDSRWRNDLPHPLAEEMLLLVKWQEDNAKDAQRDRINFWMLKMIAILASASGGLLGYLDWKLVNFLLGVIAAICVAVDGLQPRGVLYKVHLEAQYDIRQLQDLIDTKWKTGCLTNKDKQTLIVNIIEEVSAEKKRISCYLRDSESYLGPHSK